MNNTKIGLAAGCVAAAVAGYLLARQPYGTGGNTPGTPSSKMKGVPAQTSSRQPESIVTTEKIRSAEQLAAVKKDLRERFRRSLSPRQDFPLQEQVAAILETMNSQELEEFARECLPAELMSHTPNLSKLDDPLCREVLRQWVIKDPAAACESLAKTHLAILPEIFDQWVTRDAEAAKDWLGKTNFTGSDSYMKSLLERGALTRQVADDFSAARTSLAGLDDETQKHALEDWCSPLSHDPEKRAAFLSLVESRGDAALTEDCYLRVIGNMADKSPHDAANFIESTNLGEELKNKLNDEVMAQWAMKDPEQGFARWAELEREEVPVNLLGALSKWNRTSPTSREQSIAWIQSLTPGPVRDQFIRQVLGVNNPAQDTGLSTLISDPGKRVDGMKRMRDRWMAAAPNEAGAWFDKLPQVDQDALK